MKKILVFDFLFVKEHKLMNLRFVEAFSKFCDVTLLSGNGYYNDCREELFGYGVKVQSFTYCRGEGKLDSRFNCFDLAKAAVSSFPNNKFDVVFCLAFETVAMPVGTLRKLLSKSGRIYLLHHRNIDELNHPIKRLAFSFYKNRVCHVVFEDYFAKRLCELGVERNRVFVVPHPVVPSIEPLQSLEYDCIGLCNSNDECFIDSVICEMEKCPSLNLNIVLRTKKERPKSNGIIHFVQGFISDDDYRLYFLKTRYVFVPLPKTYKYRLSGSIYDALAKGKMVITTSYSHYSELDSHYPGLCFYASSAREFLLLLANNDIRYPKMSIDEFYADHSMQRLFLSLRDCLRERSLLESKTDY